MGSIMSSIMGGGGAAPQSATLTNAATKQQADEQYGNVQQGLTQQQAFLQALQAQNGLHNQSNVYNQLQQVAAGQGPNPAQAQLANATGANVANQAALMAGQRGSSANAGLMARQAAMQGAGLQQNAAGQAAALQAQQSLGAMGQAGNMANQQVSQLANQQNAYGQQALQAQNNVLNAIHGQNQAAIGNASQMNQATESSRAAGGRLMGSLMGAAGTGIGMMFGGPAGVALGGGLAKSFAGGGDSLGGSGQAGADPSDTMMAAEGGKVTKGPKSKLGQMLMAEGGKVPALVSPGEVYLPPAKAKEAAKGANPLAIGEKIPGAPKHPGNDYRNDTVPKTLQAGGVVIPNEIMQSKDAEKKAAAFVKAVLARKNHKGK